MLFTPVAVSILAFLAGLGAVTGAYVAQRAFRRVTVAVRARR